MDIKSYATVSYAEAAESGFRNVMGCSAGWRQLGAFEGLRFRSENVGTNNRTS